MNNHEKAFGSHGRKNRVYTAGLYKRSENKKSCVKTSSRKKGNIAQCTYLLATRCSAKWRGGSKKQDLSKREASGERDKKKANGESV